MEYTTGSSTNLFLSLVGAGNVLSSQFCSAFPVACLSNRGCGVGFPQLVVERWRIYSKDGNNLSLYYRNYRSERVPHRSAPHSKIKLPAASVCVLLQKVSRHQRVSSYTRYVKFATWSFCSGQFQGDIALIPPFQGSNGDYLRLLSSTLSPDLIILNVPSPVLYCPYNINVLGRVNLYFFLSSSGVGSGIPVYNWNSMALFGVLAPSESPFTFKKILLLRKNFFA